MDLIFKPIKYFENIKNKKINLFYPGIILFIIGILDSLTTIYAIDGISLLQLPLGLIPAIQFIYHIIISNFSFYLIILLQTFFFPLIIKKLGGTQKDPSYSFYIIGISSFPLLIQGIIHLLFPATLWWQYFEHQVILYFISYSFFNLFNIWSVLLLIIGFAKVYEVSYKKASILYLQFLLKLLPVLLFIIFTI